MRTLTDGDFRRWEAYATTGPHGFSRPSRIIFRCTTDPGERARVVVVDGDKSDAEARVRDLSERELRELMTEESEILG